LKQTFIVKEPFLRRIDSKRATLYANIDEHGMDSEEVLKTSQELDQLIMEYMNKFGPIPFI
jgi:hypothetical protein